MIKISNMKCKKLAKNYEMKKMVYDWGERGRGKTLTAET